MHCEATPEDFDESVFVFLQSVRLEQTEGAWLPTPQLSIRPGKSYIRLTLTCTRKRNNSEEG